MDTHKHSHIHTYSDIEKIQAGIGNKLALFLQYITSFITGFVVAFAVNWLLAIVVSVMLPLLAVTAFLIARVCLFSVYLLLPRPQKFGSEQSGKKGGAKRETATLL